MNNKNCIIVHGCPSDKEKAMNPKTRTYDKHWIPWIKKELVSRDIKVETPLMPEPWYPVYEKFKKEFEKIKIDENSILVGHSCGCAFLVRWLGETKKRIAQLILVAPWKVNYRKSWSDDIRKIREKFYTYEIDETIKNRIEEIVMFTSNNEEDGGKESLRIFHEALGGNIMSLDNHGHYCLKNMKTEEFPELLEEIIK